MQLSGFFDSLEQKASERIKAEQGDYFGEDGLLVCGKCHTPKQCRVFIIDRERTPPCLCRCEVERIEKEEDERRRIAFEKRVAELRRNGFPEAEMQDWTFANDDGEGGQIISIARRYVENFDKMREDGKGLLLFGGVGCGKTYASACIANALIDKGIPCMVTNFARIANTVQGTFEKQEVYDSFNRYSLLVLDDLAAERKTEFMQEIVFNVIDSRYRAKLPTIITTNLTAEEIKNPSDISYQRTFSRLLEMCVPIEVKGEDRRRKNLKKSFGAYSEMLGL
jgi:DNA replication protein DnaC